MKQLLFLRYLFAMVLIGLLPGQTDAIAQGIWLRTVNLLSGPPAVDVYINNNTPATFGDVQYEYASETSKSSSFLAGTYSVKVTPAGAGIGSPLVNASVKLDAATDYITLSYGTQATPKFKLMSRPRALLPADKMSLVRVLHAASVATTFDVYIDSLSGAPVFNALMRDSVSAFKQVEKKVVKLYITATGKKAVLAAFTAPLTPFQDGELAHLTLIVTGTTEQNLKVYVLHGENGERHQMATLDQAGIMLPSIRAVHAWPVKNITSLDIYLDDALKTPKLYYRGASESFQGITENSKTVQFAPVDEGPGAAVISREVTVNRDTGYAVVLTQNRDGGPTSMLLTSYLQEPNIGVLKVRLANATDFYGNISVVLTPATGDSIHFDDVRFLSYTGWRELAAGMISLQAYRTGSTTPFYTGSYAASTSNLLTLIALGDDTQFHVDVLEEGIASKIPHMQSFSGPVQGVAADADAAARALRLNNAPNPFAGSTHLSFVLPKSGTVRIDLFDALGRRVSLLADEWLEAGEHALELQGGGLSSGVYNCVLQSGGVRGVRQIMVVR